MYWNYRVVATTHPNDYVEYAIHEVYYTEEDELYLYTEEPVGFVGESVEELKRAYEMAAEAFNAPVLTDQDFRDAWERIKEEAGDEI